MLNINASKKTQHEDLKSLAMVVVKWSAGLPSTNDPSSNPAEVYTFYSVNCLKRTKINKKRPGWYLQKDIKNSICLQCINCNFAVLTFNVMAA